MTNLFDDPERRTNLAKATKSRWLHAACIAGGLLTLHATAALAEHTRPPGMVVVCATHDEAETMQGVVVAGDTNNVAAYLMAGNSSCAVDRARYVVVVQAVGSNADGKRRM